MTQAQIERRYPELRGLSYDIQLKILSRAKNEFSWKHMLSSAVVAICIGGIFGITQRLLSLNNSAENVCILGVICGLAGTLCYTVTFRKRVRKLIEDEKHNCERKRCNGT